MRVTVGASKSVKIKEFSLNGIADALIKLFTNGLRLRVHVGQTVLNTTKKKKCRLTK